MTMTSYEKVWIVIGLLGQGVFTARFLVQWVASEKKRDSVVPVAFWWLSLIGGLTLLSYAISRRDPVIALGQGMGLVVYVRNLMLVSKAKRRAVKRRKRDQGIALAHTSRTHRMDGPDQASAMG